MDASGQAGLIQNRLRLRVWDPVLNKGAIWTYWEGAYRDTGRDEGATMVLQTANRNGWFWVHPAAQQHRQSVGVVGAVRLPVQEPRQPTNRPIRKKCERCAAVKQRVSSGAPRHRLLRDEGLLVSRDTRRRRRLGDDRRRVGFLDPLYSSGVLLALKSGRARRRRDRRGPANPATRRAQQLGTWGPVFNEGVDRMRRLVCEYYDGFSFGAFVRNYPELRGTVTDLLIGDLFTDRVDKVWQPMESLYPPGKAPIPPWNMRHGAGRRAREGERAHAAGRTKAIAVKRAAAGPERLRSIHFSKPSAASFAARDPVPGPIPFNSL